MTTMDDNNAITTIINNTEDELVIANIGLTSRALFNADDRNSNFYMLGSFGLVSSIALGVALSQKRKVISLDGDGSLLTNLGLLVTLANQKPENLYIFLLDNHVYLSTAAIPTYAADGITDLGKIAEANGISCRRVTTEKELAEAVQFCRISPGPFLFHVITEPGHADPIIPLKAEEIKIRFMEYAKT